MNERCVFPGCARVARQGSCEKHAGLATREHSPITDDFIEEVRGLVGNHNRDLRDAKCAGRGDQRIPVGRSRDRRHVLTLTEIFYPERGESAAHARRFCHDCPVRAACAADAIDLHDLFGMWGGISERERFFVKARLGLPLKRRIIDHGERDSSKPSNWPPRGSLQWERASS